LLGNSLATAAIGLITGTGIYSAALAALPSGVEQSTLTAASASLVYDFAAKQLRFTGPMSTTTKVALLKIAPTNTKYQAAVTSLWQQPRDFIAANFAAFLNVADAIDQLIESLPALASAEKLTYVTHNLMPYLQRAQCQSLIIQTLCDNLGIKTKLGSQLLNGILKSQFYPTSPTTAMADFLALVGDGLSAKYYSSINPTGMPSLERVGPTINFDWGFGFSDPATITKRPFSAEWTGWIMPQYSETYTFYVMVGDGVRLSVNGSQILPPGMWKDQMPAEAVSQTIALIAGQLYPITLDYYDNTAAGIIQLSWRHGIFQPRLLPYADHRCLFAALQSQHAGKG
jgi:hypothetical protein